MKPTVAKALLLTAIILMDLLTGMEFDLFVPSFPQLEQQFQLSAFWVEALLSVNFVGYCLSLFFVGALADRFGRKPIIISGLLLFILGTLLCLSGTLFMGRFLQGVGIASPAILSFLIIADSYPLKKQQYLFAMLNGIMNASVAIAPVIGSYISLAFHWQGNFLMLLLLAVVSLTMTCLFIPKEQLPEKKEPLTLAGYVPIMQTKPLMLLIAAIVIMYVPYWIFVGTSPLLYMQELGVSLSHFGYYQGILALVFALGSIFYGKIMHRFEETKMLLFSSQIFIASFLVTLLLAFVDSKSPLLISSAILLFVIGQIIPSTILFPLSLQLIPDAKGKVSALIQGGRLIVSSVGLQLAGYCYAHSFTSIGLIIALFILFGVLLQSAVIKKWRLCYS